MANAPAESQELKLEKEESGSDIQSETLEVVENGAPSASQLSSNATRAALWNLTMPTVANLDIPPSPPGSPPPAMSQKVSQFLELKKQGTHFNEKLARSSAIKNPSLLGKLMTFAGLDHSEQYATTLPIDIWNPHGFPSWAYKDELAKAQKEAQKKREEDRTRSGRGAADFVAASEPAAKGSHGSVAERVMAGLSREQERIDPARSAHNRRRSRSPGRRRY